MQTLQIRQFVYKATNTEGDEVNTTMVINKDGREVINSILDIIDGSDIITSVTCTSGRIISSIKINGEFITKARCTLSMDQTMVIEFDHNNTIISLKIDVSKPVQRGTSKKKLNAFEMVLG